MNAPPESPLRGVILAAGRGSRLGSQTEERPKCLVELAGQSLLEWQLRAMRQSGIESVTVVGGYRHDLLVGDFERRQNPRWAETNMVATLLCVEDLLRAGPVIVSYSDIAYRPEYVSRLASAEGLAMTYDTLWLNLWALRFDDPTSDAESFRIEDGRVVDIGRRVTSADEVEGQYMGLLKFTPTAWGAIEESLGSLYSSEVARLDMTSLLRRLINAGVHVTAVAVEGGWCEVDSESDLVAYKGRLEESGGAWSHDWRSAPGSGRDPW